MRRLLVFLLLGLLPLCAGATLRARAGEPLADASHVADSVDSAAAATEAGLAEGRAAILGCALEDARRAFRRLLRRDPWHPGALAGLAEVAFIEGDAKEALAWSARGLATARGRRHADLHRVRALALVESGAVDLARVAARRAASLAPADARAQEALARAEYRSGDMESARRAYVRAVRLDPWNEEASLRLGTGFGVHTEETPWREGPLALRWREAVAAWDAGDLERAARLFRALCLLAPDVYKFRFGLGLVRRALRRSREVRYGSALDLYALLPAPEIEGVERFVPGYDRLDEHAARAVRVALLPARGWLPALLEAEASHTIMDFDDSLPEVAGLEGVRGQHTFDGRRYDHLRGAGGRQAASGAERLWLAAGLGYHLFAHEFAHQLLRYALPDALQEEVESLYRLALDEGACLDWYAVANADEYFAQGYEAFVSRAKRGCLKPTQRHTRAELAAKDPRLHAFLLRHLNLDHESEAALAAFRAALAATR